MSIPRNNNRGFWHEESGATKVCGGFQIVAGPVIGLIVGNQGINFVPTRTGVGDYLITVQFQAFQLVSATATVRNAANNVDMYAQIGAVALGAAPTVQIRTKTVGANTEIPNDDWCYFELVLRSEWMTA